MLLTGNVVSGIEAKELGLVLEVVESSELMNHCLNLARQIAAQSPVAVQTTVRTLRNQLDAKLEEALWREADCQAICYAHSDLQEGLNALKEKRKPKF